MVDHDIAKMANCGRADHRNVCRNLHLHIKNSGKLLPVKISHVHVLVRHSGKRPVPVLVKYPVLHLSDWVKCIFSYGGHFFLGGKSMDHMDEFRGKLCGFWENFRKSEPTLPLFKEDSVDYSTCIPIALHGDEGRGRQKQPVMCVGVQPILPIHKGRTNMSGTFGCNIPIFLLFIYPHAIIMTYMYFLVVLFIGNYRPSMCTRLLYTILPAPYTQRTFHDLLAALTEDLNVLNQKGYTAP